LGRTLPGAMSVTAALWGVSQLCASTYAESLHRAGFAGDGPELGDRLFEALLLNRSGVVFAHDEPEETWRRMDTPDGRVRVTIPDGRGLGAPRSAGPGVAPNELTASEDRDWLTGTPWHKHVKARIEAVANRE